LVPVLGAQVADEEETLMGYGLIAVDGSEPRRITLVVSCDGDHGFLPATASFDATTSANPRGPAIEAGWRITADGEVFCPHHAKGRS
jgi:hypothetical protein